VTSSVRSTLRCLPALLLTLGGACGSPSSPGAAVLVVDPKQSEAREPLPDVPVHRCQDARTEPLRCGLAVACKDLAERWVEQLDVGKSAKAHVAGLTYREGPCPDAMLGVQHDDFAQDAVILEHRLEVLVDDEVAELWSRTDEGWRSAARITEVAATGMASQKQHRPVASWELDVDGDEGEELVVLIRGRDSGHAAKADPFTRAWVVVCKDGAAPECGRLELGQWLEGTHEDYATPAQRESSWSGVLRILGNGVLELDADDDRRDRILRSDDFEPADRPLVPG
jgi:hypothetical protein